MADVAIVTGAARGIGAAVVDGLVAQGMSVVAVDRCRDEASLNYSLGSKKELDHVVGRHGDHAVALVGDVRSSSDMALAVETAISHFGGLNVVVAGAGVIAGGVPFWEMDQASLETVMDVNLGGAMRLFQAALPSMVASGEPGRLVAISSAAGLVGIHHATAYVAAKHGVIGLVRGLASDRSGTGITVNAVCPGSTDTAILEASASMYEGVESIHDFGHQVPLGRLLHANEPAALICFLASPAASGITGAALAVDGGMTAI